MGPTFSRLTSLSFHVNRASHSWVTTFFKIWPWKSRVNVRSQFTVTMWVEHSIDSHTFGSMSIGPPLPGIQHFQNLTLKIQGQSHSSRSQSRFNTLSTHIRFVPCWSALPFLGYSYFNIWNSCNPTQWHNLGCVENSTSRSWVRLKLKVTTWVQHSVDSHPFHSMSIRHPIPELRVFQNLILKIKDQGHGWGHSSKSQCGSNILSTHIPFVPSQSAQIQHFQNLTLKIQGHGQMIMMLHNYSPRQFHTTSNGIRFDNILAHGQAHMGQMGK